MPIRCSAERTRLFIGAAGQIGSAGLTGGTGPTPTGGMAGGKGFYRMERLDRGVVAVAVAGGVYVGWRMVGFEYDPTTPSDVAYNVYRDGTRLATVTSSTNYLDAAGTRR